jgi:hypothetical protein
MKMRRSSIILCSLAAALTIVLVLVFVLLLPQPIPLRGTWLSTVSYKGSEPGGVVLVIEEDGRVRVTANPDNSLWWAGSEYELQLRGDSIQVRAGERLSGEIQLKKRGRHMDLIDRSSPVKSLRMRRVDPS